MNSHAGALSDIVMINAVLSPLVSMIPNRK